MENFKNRIKEKFWWNQLKKVKAEKLSWVRAAEAQHRRSSELSEILESTIANSLREFVELAKLERDVYIPRTAFDRDRIRLMTRDLTTIYEIDDYVPDIEKIEVKTECFTAKFTTVDKIVNKTLVSRSISREVLMIISDAMAKIITDRILEIREEDHEKWRTSGYFQR